MSLYPQSLLAKMTVCVFTPMLFMLLSQQESMGGELPSGPTTAGMATTSMVTIGDARYDEEQDEDGQQVG